MGTVAKICLGNIEAALTGNKKNKKYIYNFYILKDFFFILSVCVFSKSARDAKCGKIQCSTSASKPKGNNAVIIETSVSDGRKKIQCKGTHVYKLSHGDEEPQSDTLDPGLVMTGTKCGDNSVSSNKCFKDFNISLFSYMSSFFFFFTDLFPRRVSQ